MAQSTLPPGVGVYVTNLMSGIGDSNYASSGTVTIYSAGGLKVSTVSPLVDYAVSSPNAFPLGLTTATLASVGSNIGAGGHATGAASATADLAGGILRASTSSAANIPYQGTGPVSTRVLTTSFMKDYVTFSVASAQGADVVFTTHLDGSYALNDPIYGAANAKLIFSFGGASEYDILADSAGVSAYAGGVQPGFTAYSFSNKTATGFDFTGTLHVSNNQRLEMYTGLYLDCSYSMCDFGHTARVGLEVPNGVSFTSDSGVFLTAANGVPAVPEPATWALMLAGFGVIGGVAKRRRNAIC